jgi:hypothetical protein
MKISASNEGEKAMKATKIAVTLFLLSTLILFMSHEALAGCVGSPQTTGGTIFDPYMDKNASGTKLYCTLTIYYKDHCPPIDPNKDLCPPPPPCPCDSVTDANPCVDMYFFIRVTKGNTIYPVSGKAAAPVLIKDVETQYVTIQEFMASTVIPAIFPNTPHAPFQWKSIDQLVYDNPMAYATSCFDCVGELFTMMDLVIGVQE